MRPNSGERITAAVDRVAYRSGSRSNPEVISLRKLEQSLTNGDADSLCAGEPAPLSGQKEAEGAVTWTLFSLVTRTTSLIIASVFFFLNNQYLFLQMLSVTRHLFIYFNSRRSIAFLKQRLSTYLCAYYSDAVPKATSGRRYYRFVNHNLKTFHGIFIYCNIARQCHSIRLTQSYHI